MVDDEGKEAKDLVLLLQRVCLIFNGRPLAGKVHGEHVAILTEAVLVIGLSGVSTG